MAAKHAARPKALSGCRASRPEAQPGSLEDHSVAAWVSRSLERVLSTESPKCHTQILPRTACVLIELLSACTAVTSSARETVPRNYSPMRDPRPGIRATPHPLHLLPVDGGGWAHGAPHQSTHRASSHATRVHLCNSSSHCPGQNL